MSKPLVVVGGGSGFVGQALARSLSERFRVVGISRGAKEAKAPFEAWRKADLFNLRDAEEALKGARYAVYLVHSMMPSARLTQGTFADLDLVCADNFARAAAKAGVEQIVYLGGLVPPGPSLSPHLSSRLEVEKTLARYGVPVTTLRAGMVIGGGGSSFEILVRLVQRLPAMVCPRWTLTRMQPVAVDDVVKLLAFSVGRAECYGEIFDVGAPEALSYRDLMTMTAELLGVRRPMLPIRLFTPSLSRLWVSLITGAPGALVGPLVESLRHEMVTRDQRLATMAGLEPTSVRVALERAIAENRETREKRGEPQAPFPTGEKSTSVVRSVQRMRLPRGKDADWAAAEYVQWLPRAFRGLIRADVEDDRSCRFYFLSKRIPLLVLRYASDRSTPDRQLFFVTGGLLSRREQRGRFELRQVLDERTLLTAIHDYGPRLAWYVYRFTQAPFHHWVMRAFARHLAAVDTGLLEPAKKSTQSPRDQPRTVSAPRGPRPAPP